MSDNLATRPSWTEDQKQTVHSIRRAMRDFVSPLSPPVPIERLTELPDGSVVPDNLDALAAIAQPATNIPAELVQATNIKASQVVYWTFRLKGTTRKAERIIFYLHGGGNTTNSPVSPTYLPRFAQVLQKAGSETIIIAPAYRLATSPENAFPAAHQDVFTVWQEVVESHAYQGTDIILAGDSSGGNLALVLAQLLIQSGHALPKKIALFAPAGDFTHVLGPEATKCSEVDLFTMQTYEDMAANYLMEEGSSLAQAHPAASAGYKRFPREHPLVSSAHVGVGSWPSWFPSTHIWVGTADQLADASHKIARDLVDSKAQDVVLQVMPDMPHGWWILDCFPQCAATWDELADFAMR